MIFPVDYRVIPFHYLKIDKNEIMNRLQMRGDFSDYESLPFVKELERVITCKYAAVRSPIEYFGTSVLDCGFGPVESGDLYSALNGCGEVFVFAVTLGVGVDRFLNKLSLTSPASHFIADAFASAYAEAATEAAEEFIKGSLSCGPRFSPGYGDLDLSCQRPLLDCVNAQRLLGVTLSDALLMTPTKTVTAIMGIR